MMAKAPHRYRQLGWETWVSLVVKQEQERSATRTPDPMPTWFRALVVCWSLFRTRSDTQSDMYHLFFA
jgi:hypothetical protein